MIVDEYNQQLLDPDGKDYHSESGSRKSTPDFIICAQENKDNVSGSIVEMTRKNKILNPTTYW